MIVNQTPCLKDVSDGSHIWVYSCRFEWIKGLKDKDLLKCSIDRNIPLTKAGSRIVTSHGDLHPGNVIKINNNLLAIDLEFASIGYASYDFIQMFYHFGED